MLKPKVIDQETEDEITKMVQGEGEVLISQSAPIKPSVEIHTVDLAAVIKFEHKNENEKVKGEENGKTKKGADGRSDNRDTAVSRKERKRWYDTIY